MKKLILTATMAFFVFFAQAQFPEIEIGEKAPLTNFQMTDIDGSIVSLESAKETNGLLVIFSCNTCPFVIAWEDRYPILADITKENKVGYILINSNYLKRNNDDSPESMAAKAKKDSYTWPYLIDKESKLANAFGAKTTPHVFLFNDKMELVYKGAIDDNYKDADSVKDFYTKTAIKAMVKGEQIEPNTTRATGCSIKRKTN